MYDEKENQKKLLINYMVTSVEKRDEILSRNPKGKKAQLESISELVVELELEISICKRIINLDENDSFVKEELVKLESMLNEIKK